MKKLEARERRLAIATALVMVGGLGWSMGVEPLYKRWRDQDAELFGLVRAVERDRTTSGKLRELGATRRALDEGLQPAEGQSLVPWIIEHLREVANDASFKASSLRYLRTEPVGDGETFAELRFEIRGRSSATELQAFLVRLAASPRHVRVVAMGVAPRKTGSALDIDMTLAALASGDAVIEREGSR